MCESVSVVIEIRAAYDFFINDNVIDKQLNVKRVILNN